MLFPAELSSECDFSSCAMFHSLCLLGSCPMFGGTAGPPVLLPTSQGQCTACHLFHQHHPQTGKVCPICSPLTMVDGKRAVPCSFPRQVGGSEVWIQTKVLCAQQRKKEEGSLGCCSGSFGAMAALVNGLGFKL